MKKDSHIQYASQWHKPKSAIRPTSLGQYLQKVSLLLSFLFLFCVLLGHYARITPSFKDKNPLKNNPKNPNNSNDRFGIKESAKVML